VAEDPAPIRLARALALAAGAAAQGAAAEAAAVVIATELGLGAADVVATRAAAWLLGVDPDAVRAVRELADLAPALERWRAGGAGADAPAVARVLARLSAAA
jgi:hypothetical protein